MIIYIGVRTGIAKINKGWRQTGDVPPGFDVHILTYPLFPYGHMESITASITADTKISQAAFTVVSAPLKVVYKKHIMMKSSDSLHKRRT